MGLDLVTIVVNAAEMREAAATLETANGVGAQLYQALTQALGGYGAMAGDDHTSDEFAAGYDGAAADTVGAIADLVGALAALARISYATATNHHDANLSSVYSATPPVYTGGQYDDLPDTTVTVAAYTPPSAVGGDDPNTPEFWDLVTDYLEGWTWPGADVAQLRTAAGTWRQVGSNLELQLVPYLTSAADLIAAQTSPEVDIAVQVIRGLSLEIEQLAVHCGELAQSCEDYATQVEGVRDIVRGIMVDVAIEVGLTVVVSAAASFFTAGIAAGAGTAVAGWRLAAAARRIISAFTAMKAAVRAAAVVRLTRVATKVPVLRRRFRRISDASSVAQRERYLHELRVAMGKPYTKDPQLTSIMDELYRADASVGSGSTAAAVRHELATGEAVGGAFHSQKARDKITQLNRWLINHPEATPGDRAAAENVIQDMLDALAGN